jgi:hypothetical protein
LVWNCSAQIQGATTGFGFYTDTGRTLRPYTGFNFEQFLQFGERVCIFPDSGASGFQSDQYCLCIGYTGSVVFSGIFTVLSQPGSPTAGGAVGDGAAPTQAVGGLAVALKMVAAAEQAKNWWKLLPKPPVFDHATREAEIAAWKEWPWTFEQYVGSVDSKFLDDIEQLRSNPNVAVDPVDFTDLEKQRNTFFYSLLSSLLRQRALLVVRLRCQ